MRTTHIAWIGAVLTFAVVLGIGLSRQDAVAPRDSAAAGVQHLQDTVVPASRTMIDSPTPAGPPAAAAPQLAPVGDPPEDGRAMLDAAAADSDAAVRDEAAALSQALATEAAGDAE